MNKIFSINTIQSDELKRFYSKAFTELKDFFELNWVHSLPQLYILNGRKEVDRWHDKEDTRMSGWTYGSHQFYIVDKETFKKEAGEDYQEDDYFMLLKHEMAHCFYQIITKGVTKPIWLWEGVAIYAAGQNNRSRKPSDFQFFLNSQDTHEKGVYEEAGFAIEALIKKYGKSKLLSMLSQLSNGDFDNIFESFYGWIPAYESFNNLLI